MMPEICVDRYISRHIARLSILLATCRREIPTEFLPEPCDMLPPCHGAVKPIGQNPIEVVWAVLETIIDQNEAVASRFRMISGGAGRDKRETPVWQPEKNPLLSDALKLMLGSRWSRGNDGPGSAEQQRSLSSRMRWFVVEQMAT